MTAIASGLRIAQHTQIPMHSARVAVAAHVPPALPDIADIGALLMRLKTRNRDQAAHNAAAGVAVSDVAREEASTRAREALERSKASQEDAGWWSKFGSTLSTVATVAAVVAAAASVVCTGGASTPAILALAGTLLSASSPLVAKCAGEDAGKVAMYGGIALSLGGAGWSLASKTAVTEGAKLVTSPTVRAIGAGVVMTARTTEGGARIAEGYSKVREKRSEASVQHAQADVLDARSQLRRSQAQVEALVQSLKELDESVSRAMQTITRMVDEHQQSKQQLVSNLRRV